MLIMKSYISGNIRKILFENVTNSYKVGILKVRETNIEEMQEFINKTITFTGNFTSVNKELDYIMYGTLTEHYRYGLQFNVSSYEIKTPTDTDGLIMYLSSGLFKGIGLSTAKKIVDRFKENTIEIIKNDYKGLIPLINETKAKNLYTKLNEYEQDQKTIMLLNSLGFTIQESLNLINKYKLNLNYILDNNIYLLSEDVDFLKLDLIFLKNNSPTSEVRIKEVIKYIIKDICFKTGDTLVNIEILYLNTKKFLKNDISLNTFLKYIDELQKLKEIIKINDNIMLKSFYVKEEYIANKIKLLSRIKTTVNVDKEIEKYEKNNNIKFNIDQKEAIKGSLNNNLFIISGGPGTGKTTIVKALVDIYKKIYKIKNDDDIALIAPTGRSARRLGEAVHHKASTIHKFLKWNKDLSLFQINENNKSEAKFIIVDEFSMVDMFLFTSLLEGLNDYVKLILVGDANQLPSINPGNILSDLIFSDKVPKKFLNYIYRMQEGSYIIDLANKIYNREYINKIDNNSDFTFISSDNINIKENINKICLNFLNKKINLNNFQVLIPMYKGENGIDNINNLMQEIFNKKSELKKEIKYGDKIYRENDKVIQLINDVDNNIYNGDIGFIKKINESSMEIDFGGNKVELSSKDYDKISLAYAVSIHKSQGSEYDYVVVILSKNFRRMLYNKLIYTAVTRAKKHLIIIGSLEEFNYAIQTLYSSSRLSNLSNLLNV